MKRGLTILELLVALIITATVVAGVGGALRFGLDFDRRFREAGGEERARAAFESEMERLIARAWLNPDSAATDSFFVASRGPLSGGDVSSEADTLTFTALGSGLTRPYRESEDDFETLNDQFGPQGGVQEFAIEVQPVGAAPDPNGLFLRTQVPADGDPTQGGRERTLNTEANGLTYEFFDGSAWRAQWDTRTQAAKRLPAAVRVTYRWGSDETERQFTVRLPQSDATPENPVTEEGS